MAQTTKANMIVPAVWASMVQAEFLGKIVLGPEAGFTLTDNTLEGKPGDTVHFPKFGALGDATDLTEGVPMVPEALTTSDSTATIKEAGKAVEITDTALLTGFGDPLAEVRRQYGVLIARKIDKDLIAAAEAGGALTNTVAGPMSWNAVADSLGKFGDDADPADFAGMVIHSNQHTTLLKDANFISRDKVGDQSVITRGVVGVIGGMRVYVSDRVTTVAGTPNKFKALLVKRNALGLLYKRRPIVETDRDILARTTVLTTNVHYAVKRLNDRGVCVLTTDQPA